MAIILNLNLLYIFEMLFSIYSSGNELMALISDVIYSHIWLSYFQHENTRIYIYKFMFIGDNEVSDSQSKPQSGISLWVIELETWS